MEPALRLRESEPHLAEMERLPSEQIRQQMRFTPYPFEAVDTIVNESAPELYLFSSDYPHAEGGRDPIGRFDRTTESLGDAQAGKGLLAGIAIALVAMMIDRILRGIRASFSRI